MNDIRIFIGGHARNCSVQTISAVVKAIEIPETDPLCAEDHFMSAPSTDRSLRTIIENVTAECYLRIIPRTYEKDRTCGNERSSVR